MPHTPVFFLPVLKAVLLSPVGILLKLFGLMEPYLMIVQGSMEHHLMMVLVPMEHYLMIVVGPMEHYVMMVLGPMRTYLGPMVPYLMVVLGPMLTILRTILNSLVGRIMLVVRNWIALLTSIFGTLKIGLDLISFFCIVEIPIILVTSAIILAFFHFYSKRNYIVNIMGVGHRRPALCTVCQRVYTQMSSANKHFSKAHVQKCWEAYFIFFKYSGTALLGVQILRELLQISEW